MSGGILLTGGSGRLGKALQALIPGLMAPGRAALELTRPASIEETLERSAPRLVVHAAAYTDVAGAERNRGLCWRVNALGTAHLVRVLGRLGTPLVYLSTDYVFYGDTGGYTEDDSPGPVRNYYALSKLAAENAVRALRRHLVIRTSFRSGGWPHPVAYTDLFTSQDYLEAIAPQVALAVGRFEQIPYDTLHIGTERKSAFELARRRNPSVRPGLRADAPVELPQDISLDISRWKGLKEEWGMQ